MRIGILLTGGKSWHGGITYIESCVRALASLPTHLKPELNLIINKDELNSSKLFERVFPMIDKIIYVGDTKKNENFWWQNCTVSLADFSKICDLIDIIFPVNSNALPGIPSITWFPDFQHRRFPKLFSKADWQSREQKNIFALEAGQELIVSSDDARNDLRSYYPGYLNDVEIIHFYSLFEGEDLNLSPINTVKKYAIPEKFIICCNQFWEHKNHDTLFKALAKADQKIHLVCTGEASDYRNQNWFDHLKKIIFDLGLEHQVYFLGFISRVDQIQLMRQSIAIVQPSFFEGWSTVMEDARGLGKIVIASNIGVHKEQAIPNALYFSPNSVEELAILLDQVYQSSSPGPDFFGESIAVENVKTLQKIEAKKILDVSNRIIFQMRERSESTQSGQYIQKIRELTVKILKLQSHINDIEQEIYAKEEYLIDLVEKLNRQEVLINDYSTTVQILSKHFRDTEVKIKKLNFQRNFLDLILALKAPHTAPNIFFAFSKKYFWAVIKSNGGKVIRCYRSLTSKLWRSVYSKEPFKFSQSKVSSQSDLIDTVSTREPIGSESYAPNDPTYSYQLATLHSLEGLIDEKINFIKNKNFIILATKQDIASKEAEIVYNQSTVENLRNGQEEKNSIIKNLKIHIAWQYGEIKRYAKPSFFLRKTGGYFKRLLKRLIMVITYYLDWFFKVSLNKISTVKAENNYQIQSFWLKLQIIKLRLMPIKLGQLYIHPPVFNYLLRKSQSLRLEGAPLSISIVTPSFNQGQFIDQTIKSILSQKYPLLEYMIQDGASTDNTDAIVKKYLHKNIVYESIADDGQSNAINSGMQKSSGEIMAWLNSDDILLPGSLNYVSNFFTDHPDVDVIYGHRLIIDAQGRAIGEWILPSHDSEVLSWADFVPQETLFWRRRSWEWAGSRIDENFQFAMDWDLLLRFRDSGANFVRVPQFLAAFRVHEQQKTSSQIHDLGQKEMNTIRERIFGKVPTDYEVHQAITPYLKKHQKADLLWRIKKLFSW
jgi:glycosyltransferase involved in cell wall biosynthesis